ncbi:secreted protein containing Beta-lactamase-like domain protein [Candidatus Magnetoovum chiemensis]|nr:secreted protein containing Beta-lactamase-like domain protein [Candidatus Magnetoovum chiemensis]
MDIKLIMLLISAGDATLLLASDSQRRYSVLIDAGLRDNEVISYLQSIGVFHIDLVIISHPDMDHLGGLLSIMKSAVMSVDRIWCFDLNFLRNFILTGKIPTPKEATHDFLYMKAMVSTLDKFSDILETANGKTKLLQVSEGYKFCLGPMLFEVLYPPQSFYDSLHTTDVLKHLLIGRKVPDDWRDRPKSDNAKEISPPEDKKRLENNIGRGNFSNGEYPLLTEFDLNKQDEDELEQQTKNKCKSEKEADMDSLSLNMIGRLYNNMSIVVKVSILGGISGPTALFTGDLTDWTTLVIRNSQHLRADILKLPHHGSSGVKCNFKRIKERPCFLCFDYFDYDYYRIRYCRESLRYDCLFCNILKLQCGCYDLLKLFGKYSDIELIKKLVNPSHAFALSLSVKETSPFICRKYLEW